MSEASWNESDEAASRSEEVSRRKRRKEMARALAKGGMTGVHVISHESAERVLTEKRRELIDVLRREEVESVRDLARRVERDKAQVSRDLRVLAEHAVVGFEEGEARCASESEREAERPASTGRAKRPYLQSDHLVVEPIY